MAGAAVCWAGEDAMAIPVAIKYFLYVEAILFGPFSLHHYLSFTDRKQLKHLTNNRVAWMIIHSGEMLNGVGAWVVMFVVLHALIDNEISTIELEILMLAHSLWMGMILAYWPLAKEAAILHLPLTIGAFFVGWNYVPIWSLCLDFAIMVYGRVKFWTDIYPNIIVDAERVGRARTRRRAPARARPASRDRRYERDMARFRDFIVPGSHPDGGDDGLEPARILDRPRKKKHRGKAEAKEEP